MVPVVRSMMLNFFSSFVRNDCASGLMSPWLFEANMCGEVFAMSLFVWWFRIWMLFVVVMIILLSGVIMGFDLMI